MTEKSRRKVLKGLAITLPAVWATPVVESVILPAHAGDDGSGVPTGPECEGNIDCPDGTECIQGECVEI